MKKRMIGLVPLVDAERESYWMLPGYMNGIEQAGGIPVMLPLTADPDTLQQLADTLDGFLLTGGQDVSPVFYQAQTVAHCEACCAERDAMEQALFGIAWAQDKPILGICCGIQLINILLGGMLYQDLPTKHPSPVQHRQAPPYTDPCHTVGLVEGSPLHWLLRQEVLPVNSCHHQAVNTLASELSPMAVSEDGLIGAVYAPGRRFLWAVQWHPEFFDPTDWLSRAIFSYFLRS
ncbi:gamma-glutamyl-gamma-aminobutyrate hydrolase family protein [bacterium 210917-SL.2.15]|nr:gamma-glutamyl-gamma-aminobutyrate hydrolase family protein [bacterium 210917-SL.2.15]